MKFKKVPCDDHAQDRWAEFYLKTADGLSQRFGMEGRGIVRDAVRMLGVTLGEERAEFLKNCSMKINLQNVFTAGGPLPCGDRTCKEWLDCSPQQVLVNVLSCPYADCWLKAGKAAVGRMFCEEFYPAYLHAACGCTTQINVGKELVNEGDDMCRLSVYLRPANLTEAERCAQFDEFDPHYARPDGQPEDIPNYDHYIALFQEYLMTAAEKWLAQKGIDTVKELIK